MKVSFVAMAFAASLVLAPLASVQAQSHAELQTMVQQLQTNPSDTALRERIIQTARQLKPAPAIPAEARDYFIQGTTIAKAATDASGQQLAVDKFEKALAIAPWWGDALYNLAIAQELAGQLDAAQATLKIYALTDLTDQERQDALDKNSVLKAKQQLAEQQAIAAARQKANDPKAKEEAFLNSLEGAVFARTGVMTNNCYFRRAWVVSGRGVLLFSTFWCPPTAEPSFTSGTRFYPDPIPLARVMTREDGPPCPVGPMTSTWTLEISADGRALSWSDDCPTETPTQLSRVK